MSIKKQIKLMDKIIVEYLEHDSASCPQILNLIKAQHQLYETAILSPYLEYALDTGVVYKEPKDRD